MSHKLLTVLLLSLILGGCPQGSSGDDDPADQTGDPNTPAGDPGDGGDGGDGGTGGGGGSGGAATLGVTLSIASEGARHVPQGTQVTYSTNPPASGPHWPTPAARGFYDTAVEEEAWVHSLEHGYVVLLFDCRGDCDPGLLTQLREFFNNAPASAIYGYPKLVVTPYSGLPEGARLTIVAWDYQLHLAAFDQPALLAFMNQFQDQGPEDIP